MNDLTKNYRTNDNTRFYHYPAGGPGLRKKYSMPSTMFVDGGQKKLKAAPANSMTEFKYHYEDVHRCKMKITEVIPDKKVVWLVLDNYFNFIKDESEWKGQKLFLKSLKQDDKTQIRFTHQGLVPAI